MKIVWIVLAVVAVLTVVTVGVLALLPKNPNVGDPTKVQVTYSAEQRQRLDTVTVTRSQLAAANGASGTACQVAVSGVVYDLSALKGWARGNHHGVSCGTDATQAFIGSAHGRAVLEQLPVVGRLVD